MCCVGETLVRHLKVSIGRDLELHPSCVSIANTFCIVYISLIGRVTYFNQTWVLGAKWYLDVFMCQSSHTKVKSCGSQVVK